MWLVVLSATPSVLAVRDAARESTGYGRWSPEEFAALVEATPLLGLWLDTSILDVDTTVELVLARLDQARVDLPPLGAPGT